MPPNPRRRPSLPVEALALPHNSTDAGTSNDHLNKDLDERFDALNKALCVAELRLKELRPFQAVWVHYNHQTDDVTGAGLYEALGIDKVNSQWRLVHGHDDDRNEGLPYNVKPLVECPINVRIRAVQELYKLKAKIVAVKEKFIPEVENAITDVLNFCQGGSNDHP